MEEVYNLLKPLNIIDVANFCVNYPAYANVCDYIRNERPKDEANNLLVTNLKKGDFNTTELLLYTKFADINVKDNNGITLLMYFSNNIKAIQLLLKYGADVTAKDNDGKTVLIHAVINNNLDVTKLLLDVYPDNIDIPDSTKNTPLLYAVADGNIEMTKLFLEKGAYVSDNTLFLVIQRDDEPLLELLLDYKANPNIFISPHTPLMYAAANDKYNMCEMLLEHGADVNFANDNGMTAILYACKNGSVELVNLLVYYGALIFDSDNRGQDCLMKAAQGNNVQVMERLLHDDKFNINEQDIDGDTALNLATMYEQEDAIRILLMDGANVNIKNKNKKSALDIANETNNTELIGIFFEYIM